MWKVSGLALTIAVASALYSGPAAAGPCEQIRSACYAKCGCCVCGSHWTLHCCVAGEYGNCNYLLGCRTGCDARRLVGRHMSKRIVAALLSGLLLVLANEAAFALTTSEINEITAACQKRGCATRCEENPWIGEWCSCKCGGKGSRVLPHSTTPKKQQ